MSATAVSAAAPHRAPSPPVPSRASSPPTATLTAPRTRTRPRPTDSTKTSGTSVPAKGSHATRAQASQSRRPGARTTCRSTSTSSRGWPGPAPCSKASTPTTGGPTATTPRTTGAVLPESGISTTSGEAGYVDLICWRRELGPSAPCRRRPRWS